MSQDYGALGVARRQLGFFAMTTTSSTPSTRGRVHAHLRALGLDIPTVHQQKADLARALELYTSAVDELRRLTRDTERFPLVYKGNTEYGFRRNLLGLKKIGLSVAGVALGASGWALWRGWNAESVILPVPAVPALLTGCLAFWWLIGVHSTSVRTTADRYARHLLEAALDLEPTQ